MFFEQKQNSLSLNTDIGHPSDPYREPSIYRSTTKEVVAIKHHDKSIPHI